MAARNRHSVFALALALAAAPGVADRLPLNGHRWIETRGTWTIDGGRVVFTTPDGVLRSLALAETTLGEGAVVPSSPDEPGAALSFTAWPSPEALPEVRPLPAPLPAPGRQAPRVVPAGCRLVTEQPGDAPRFVCPQTPEWTGRTSSAPAESDPE